MAQVSNFVTAHIALAKSHTLILKELTLPLTHMEAEFPQRLFQRPMPMPSTSMLVSPECDHQPCLGSSHIHRSELLVTYPRRGNTTPRSDHASTAPVHRTDPTAEEWGAHGPNARRRPAVKNRAKSNTKQFPSAFSPGHMPEGARPQRCVGDPPEH